MRLAKLIKGMESVYGLVVSGRKAGADTALLKYGVFSLESQQLKRTIPKPQLVTDYHTAFYTSGINDTLATAALDACATKAQ